MYNDIYNKIKQFDNIFIARHIGVDPDALCSQLALRDSIQLTFPNKNVFAIGMGSTRFSGFGRLDKYIKMADSLLIVCDTPDNNRVDLAKVEDFSFSIKIDHHPFIEKFCDIELIEDNTSSTCEIIMKILKETNLLCNSNISQLLYLGLVSDSNRFLFNSCINETFSLVSYYLEHYPFDLSKSYDLLYLRPLSEVRLEGYISLNMIVTDNKLGYIVISNDKLLELGVDTASPGNMINNFNYIKEVLVWVTITEDKKNKQYRLSIRSRGPVINGVAEKHHGGGHKYASGVKSPSLDAAMKVIDDLDLLLSDYLKKEYEETCI